MLFHPCEQGDVADHVGAIQPLAAHLQSQGLQDAVRRVRKGNPGQIMLHQAHPEVVRRLLTQVRLSRRQLQRMELPCAGPAGWVPLS